MIFQLKIVVGYKPSDSVWFIAPVWVAAKDPSTHKTFSTFEIIEILFNVISLPHTASAIYIIIVSKLKGAHISRHLKGEPFIEQSESEHVQAFYFRLAFEEMAKREGRKRSAKSSSKGCLSSCFSNASEGDPFRMWNTKRSSPRIMITRPQYMDCHRNSSCTGRSHSWQWLAEQLAVWRASDYVKHALI